ncbi:MAG: ATP-binding protein [Gammaproteobacteria bacterium]|nr:ATP-binding protein [Gammaproteobacteria bacterium]
MTLWPRSLSGRLIIILLAGLILAQAVSMVLYFQDRGHAIFRLGSMQLSDRVASVVRRMEAMEPGQWRRVAAESSSRHFHVTLHDTFEPLDLDRRRYRRFAGFVSRRLQRELGAERAVDAVVSNTPPASSTQLPEPGDSSFARHQPLYFVARVELPGGAADFLFHLPRDTSSGPGRLLWALGILLISVVLLVLFAVRQTTRPLSMLSDAATRLGEDINEPPLPETGPREVGNAARAFNRMQRKIQDYLRQRSGLLAAVSHDLKTPITRLRIRAEMLEDELLKEKIETDLKDMESMVNEALDFVRGADQYEPSSPIDLAALIESLQDDFDDSGRRIHCDLADLPPCTGRPLALKRCLSNLIENALKYGDRLWITMTRESDRRVIRFRDDGPGLPEELLERVFEPFFRAEPSRSRQTGGSGLGLAIARGIARAHGGDVTLANAAEGGLVVTLTLPDPHAGDRGRHQAAARDGGNG